MLGNGQVSEHRFPHLIIRNTWDRYLKALYRWGNWDSVRISHLPKFTEFITTEMGLTPWLIWPQSPCTFYFYMLLPYKCVPVRPFWIMVGTFFSPFHSLCNMVGTQQDLLNGWMHEWMNEFSKHREVIKNLCLNLHNSIWENWFLKCHYKELMKLKEKAKTTIFNACNFLHVIFYTYIFTLSPSIL